MATETELKTLFPDCERGAIPPTGARYDLPVYLDSVLAGQNMIVFNGGTHKDAVHMHMIAFRELVAPKVVPLVRSEVAGLGRDTGNPNANS